MLTATYNNVSHRLLRLDASVVPIIYASKLTSLVDLEGVAADKVLQKCNLKRRSFFNPQATISTLQVKSLVKGFLDISGNPNLAFDLGKQLDFEANGLSYHNAFYGLNLGFIITSSIEYLKVRVPLVELKFDVGEHDAFMTIEVGPELKEIEPFIIETVFGSFNTMFGGQVSLKRLLVAYGPPQNSQVYSNVLDTDVIFNCEKHQLIFDKSSLDNLYTPNIENSATPLLKSKKQEAEESIVDKVRAIIASEHEAIVSLEKVASLLELSSRTCRRQLKTQGYSYNKIREEVLYTKAVSYLTESNMPVEDIALKLGYSDNANFRRAFKRWAGKPPSAFRESVNIKRTPH